MDVTGFRSGSDGEILAPGDPGYDDARAVWNGVIDRRPAAIARCTSTDDAAAAVRFASASGLVVAVRGGGHNVAGLGTVDDGLLVDLSPMNAVEVDPERRIARVGGGAKLGDLDSATQAHGLATPMGVVSETGVAGLTLTGGMGWLRRKHGLSCDTLLAAEVVTADGEVVRASQDEHPDLLWALRGGGGNFGAVTTLEFELHPLGPDVAMTFVLYPGDRAADVLLAADRLVHDGPEGIAPLGVLGRVPADEAFPAEAHGKPFAAIIAVYAGDADEGEDALRPFRELGDPIADLSDRMPYVDAQKLLDEEYPNGRHYYWKAIELSELSESAIERMSASADEMPSDLSTIDVWYQGGAMGRVAADATAFGDRSAPILIGVEANWEGAEADDANIAWARACVDELRPFSGGGTYLNFPGFLEEREQQLRAAYGENYDRLVEVKTRYDPENLFRVNQNIPPASA